MSGVGGFGSIGRYRVVLGVGVEQRDCLSLGRPRDRSESRGRVEEDVEGESEVSRRDDLEREVLVVDESASFLLSFDILSK